MSLYLCIIVLSNTDWWNGKHILPTLLCGHLVYPTLFFFFFFYCPWCIIDSPLQLGPWNLLVSLPALCTLQPTSHKLQVAFLDSKGVFLPPLYLSCSLCLECSLSRPSEGLFSKRIQGSPPMLVFFNLLSTDRCSYLSSLNSSYQFIITE